MRILVDMDAILADFLEGLWDVIEADIGFRGDTNKVVDFYRIQNGLSDEALEAMRAKGKTVEDYFHAEGFFLNLKPIAGALEVLQTLVGDGHEVVIVSTPSSESSYIDKVKWLKNHCAFLPHKKVFLGHEKHMIKGDVLIDDGGHNAVAYAKEWPEAKIYTIAYPYNEGCKAYTDRFGPWDEPAKAWLRIYGAICAAEARA